MGALNQFYPCFLKISSNFSLLVNFGVFWGPLGHPRYSWGLPGGPHGCQTSFIGPNRVFPYRQFNGINIQNKKHASVGSPMRTKNEEKMKKIIFSFFKIFPTIYFVFKLVTSRGYLGIINHLPNPSIIFSELSQLRGAVLEYEYEMCNKTYTNINLNNINNKKILKII